MKKVIRILKEIPVNSSERIEPLGLYKVFKTVPEYYLIESGATGKGVWVRKGEAEVVEGETMSFTYRDMATCIKFLERMRFKLALGHYNEYSVNGRKIRRETPIEFYLLNEFPFNSAFCYLFRRFKVKGKAPKGVHVCYCPLKPYENTHWPIHRGSYMGADGKDVEYARRSCDHFKGKKSGTVKIRTFQQRLERVEATPVLEIMRHLKKIKIRKVQKKHLANLWYFHIKHRVEEWELHKKKKFI